MIEGKPADEMVTEGQLEIFFEIVFRKHRRLQILCSTQYGKSLFVALACIIVTCVQNERVAILAPTDEKAKIIMRYFVEHLGDHAMFWTQLEKRSKLDRLRMEDTKERIIMRKGGGIFMISVQAGNSKKGIESAMGEGARNVIMDEACLIPDPIEATVFRMIAGKGEEAFYCKIGNPFYRNHFLTSNEDPTYHHITIDYEQGMRENRYNAQFISEARKKPYFDVLFECKFPTADLMDTSGYISLIPDNRIIMMPKVGSKTTFIGRRILGIDPAGEGSDIASFVVRDAFTAEQVYSMKTSNPREIAMRALLLQAEYNIESDNDIVVDGFGCGATVGQEVALATKGDVQVYTVMTGNKPTDEEKYNTTLFERSPAERHGDDDRDIYLNLRALLSFRAKDWILKGGSIVDNPSFKNELSVIKYRRSLQGNTIQIMSKKEMAKLGISSPNVFDAFSLTFMRDIGAKRQTAAERRAILAEREEVDDPYAVL